MVFQEPLGLPGGPVSKLSYLFCWYWIASGKTLFTDLAIVPPTAISLPRDATLYYISEGGAGVYARDLDNESDRLISELNPNEARSLLYVREWSTHSGERDLLVGPANEIPSGRVIATVPAYNVAEPLNSGTFPGGDVPRFQADTSGWEFHFGWMAGRLDGKDAKSGRHLDVALETPFIKWPVHCPTQLPSGQVVFQLGWNQICIVDPNERKLALLAKGRGPVVTMKKPAQVEQATTKR
jgi:hypothetical protein